MELPELKQEIIDNKLRHFYIFTGTELALQDVYIKQIAKVANLPYKRVESLTSIRPKLTMKTLIPTPPSIYVIRDDEYITSKTIQNYWDKFKNFKGSIVILLYEKVPAEYTKRMDVINFDQINPVVLLNRLIATTGISEQGCKDLITGCSGDYGRIQNEIYKLCILSQVDSCNLAVEYIYAKNAGAIHEDVGDIIFEFTGAISQRQILKAYQLLPKMKQTDDGPLVILSVLYQTFRKMLMIQSTPANERNEQVLGIPNNQIYAISKQCGSYDLYELVKILKTIRYLEKGIKTGTVEEKFSIDYLLGAIW